MGAVVGAMLGVLAAVTIIVTTLVMIFVLWRKNSIRKTDCAIANPTYEGMYIIIIGSLLYCFYLFMLLFMLLHWNLLGDKVGVAPEESKREEEEVHYEIPRETAGNYEIPSGTVSFI